MNVYSADWFATFLPPESPPPVDRELTFFREVLPATEFPRVLDVACGIGRHSRALAEHGYRVLGIDLSEEALRVARHGAPAGVEFRTADIRDVGLMPTNFDVAMCLWQSWGDLDHDENVVILEGLRDRLRAGGRLLLDVYNRRALPGLPAFEVGERNGREYRTTRVIAGDRFRVRIEYSDSGVVDRLEWQVFSPSEIVALGEAIDLRHVLTCAWFDPATPPARNHVRMQVLFERP